MENQLAQALVQRGGYNPIDAANAAKGPRSSELAREFLGASSSSSSTAGQADYASIARQQLQLQQEANRPAIESLQASIPEIQKSTQQAQSTLEASKTPLQARYQSIIDQLKGRETTETAQVSTNLSQEYGKRGILPSSGMFQQDLAGKTSQISQNYGGAIKDVGLSQEQDLMDIANKIAQLPLDETEKTRAVQNAIAQLQAGASSEAITNALTLYQQQQSNQQETTRENRLGAAQDLANKIYAETTLPESKATVANTQSLINERNSKTDTGSDVAKLNKIFNPNWQTDNSINKIFGNSSQPSLDSFWTK